MHIRNKNNLDVESANASRTQAPKKTSTNQMRDTKKDSLQSVRGEGVKVKTLGQGENRNVHSLLILKRGRVKKCER